MSAHTIERGSPDAMKQFVGKWNDLSPKQRHAVAMATSPGYWSQHTRHLLNTPLHWEWYRLMMTSNRMCVIAPRDHAKTEVFTVNQTAWRSLYKPGTWTYVFANTVDQAKALKKRIDDAVHEAKPVMVDKAGMNTSKETVYANGSRVTCAGAGSAVRGAHPDIIIGDDVLEENLCLTAYQREKTKTWWSGTVSNMAHPDGTIRVLPTGVKQLMPPTRVFLVGTPFHQQDLLMSMKTNAMYSYRRYQAEFSPHQLVDGLAVEVA